MIKSLELSIIPNARLKPRPQENSVKPTTVSCHSPTVVQSPVMSSALQTFSFPQAGQEMSGAF